MRLQFKTDSSLARGKESISSSTTFIFDELGEKSSLLSGNPKDVYGDQHIIIKYFPSIFVNHLMNESYLDLFAGDTRRDKWSRTYKVHDAKNIFVESILESKKVVMLESPNPPPDDIMITYPDGSISHSSKTYADYEKLLSIE